jgi:hypothetical protein
MQSASPGDRSEDILSPGRDTGSESSAKVKNLGT